jgi:hypothetical protein
MQHLALSAENVAVIRSSNIVGLREQGWIVPSYGYPIIQHCRIEEQGWIIPSYGYPIIGHCRIEGTGIDSPLLCLLIIRHCRIEGTGMDCPFLWLSDHQTLSDRGNRDGCPPPMIV